MVKFQLPKLEYYSIIKLEFNMEFGGNKIEVHDKYIK